MSTLDAQPTEAEREVYDKVRIVLEKSQAILKDIQQYTGATESIRQVRTKPTKKRSESFSCYFYS